MREKTKRKRNTNSSVLRDGIVTNFVVFSLILLPLVNAFTQTPSAAKSVSASSSSVDNSGDSGPVLTLADAIELGLRQASNYKTARINELMSAEDIRQAKAAFYPKLSAKPNIIYTTPSLASSAGLVSRPPSFLGANGVAEIQGLIVSEGEIDTSGKLTATLRRNEFLLASAKAGSEVARTDLIQAISDSYLSVALAVTKRRGAENNLRSAEDFEDNLKLQLDAGEVAPVDLVRARLQTAARRDELSQTRSDESIAAAALKFLIGYDFVRPVGTVELLSLLPVDGEIDLFTEAAIRARPEYAQFDADMRAAEQDVKAARAERLPQINYAVSTGFISPSFRPESLKDSIGVQVNFGITIPLFDHGASRSRETQAKLRIQQAENSRILTERGFVQAFFTARTQALQAAERIKQIRSTMVDADTNVSASLARYRTGEASIIEVTDAQNTLVATRQALYQAIFDYQSARAHLMHATGK